MNGKLLFFIDELLDPLSCYDFLLIILLLLSSFAYRKLFR